MIPQLRFPEFTDEWRVEKLGEVAKKVSERNSSSSADMVLTNSAVRGIIPQTDFFDKEIAVQGNLANYYKTHRDDFVYNPRISASAPVGPFKRNLYGTGVMSPLYNLYRFRNSEVLDYFEQYFDTTHWHKYMREVANYGARSDRMAISSNDLADLPLPYPSKPEQEKIAEFLTAVDERIAAIEKKLELLKKYKKGVMQKIFTQAVRFADENGNSYPDWEEKRLKDIAYSETSPLSANQIEGESGPYKVYGASGFLQTINTYHYEDEYIAVVKDGAGVGRISFCEPKSSVLGTLIVIQPKENINKKLLYYMLQLIDFKKYTTGSTIPHVYFKQYSKEKFFVPTSAEEQQKIATFFATLDNKIAAEQTKLTVTRQFKKALLQRMFV